jgi:DNA repair exonuclease SbcCD nuclease subunit
MRFLIYGDLQASDGHERCFNDPTMPLQRWRVNRIMDFLKETYDTYECDGLIDLGDTTDDRQAIPIPTIHSVLTPLSSFKGKNIKLMGNHEQWLRSTEVHPGVMYNNIFKVVKSHEVIDFPGCEAVFACVSYIDNEEDLKKAIIETVKKAHSAAGNRKVILLGHFTVEGAITHGLALKEGITNEEIPKVDSAFLGHIHKFQEFKPRHFYVGSPFQQNFGEINETKYVVVLDTQSGKAELIDTKMPQYRRHTLDQFEATVREESEDRFEVKMKSFEEAQRFYGHPLSHRAVPVYDYIESATNKPNVETSQKEIVFDVHNLMKAYLENNPPSKKGIDIPQEDLLTFGQELMAQ